jgi:hypothetical protein
MGNYTPYAPQDLGMQWVPIKQADYTSEQFVERGYSFVVGHSVIPVSGSFNVTSPPANNTLNGVEFMSVYPAGLEDQTGPVQQIIIPVSAVGVTGSGVTNATASALANPSDLDFIGLPANSFSLGLSFDVNTYLTALSGKRILDVSLLYAADGLPAWLANITVNLALASDPSNASNGLAVGLEGPLTDFTRDRIGRLAFGDLNPFWNLLQINPPSLLTLGAVYPWRSQELAYLAATATPASIRMLMTIVQSSFPVFAGGGTLDYAALQVTFCEETRVKYGGKWTNANASPVPSFRVGTNLFPLRGTDFTVTGALAPGEYVATLRHDYVGSPRSSAPDGLPLLRAIRQLYEIPSHRGISLRQTLVPDASFTVESSQVLPQIALHHAGAVVTGSHVYGTQIGARVYGAVLATQDVDPGTATGQQYPQVRFYARRFGDTTIALSLRSVAAPTTTVSISIADFDALPELVDGWREVTLRFTGTIPTFTGPAGTPQAWQWDAVGETVGNQWQVMGANGPTVTGTQAYGPATYFAPFGSTEELTWTNPNTGTSAADTATDAVIIFAQDPPTISGFTLTASTQAVTGIGLACGSTPRCIPTGIGYTRLTWQALTSIPVTGFGAYDLERFDALDNEWQQIMSATSPTVTGYNDFEARVGVQSQYRIRACDALDFCGPWTTGAATIAAPGVTPGGGAGVLIFTSNSNQAGAYNLAHRMQWEDGSAQENFAFPEAGTTVLQDMYGKDFPTAFRPLERGGEQFSRVLLVQGAAIAAESLANFRSLRDMAWADVPYIAVRDELGNRWYATVLVPSGNVRRNRTLYFAQVDVIEVSDTAAVVELP